MPKYHISADVRGSKYLGEIEAKSKAFEMDESYISLCYHCSSEVEDPQVFDIIVEEVDE